MHRFLTKARQSIRARGAGGTLGRFFRGLLPRNFMVLYLRPSEVSDFTHDDPELTFRRVTLDELQEFREERQDLPDEFFCDETYGFSTPYVALVRGRLAAIHWLAQPGEYSKFLALGDGDAELNYNVVIGEFRGLRLAQKLMHYILNDLKTTAGSERVFGVVSVTNIAQLKPMLRLGFLPVEIVTHYPFWRPKATLKYAK